MIAALLAASLAAGACPPRPPAWENAWLPSAGVAPDEATAKAIALAVLRTQMARPELGLDDLKAELLKAKDGFDVWVVRDAPDFLARRSQPAPQPPALGGLPFVFIDRCDGRVLDYVQVE